MGDELNKITVTFESKLGNTTQLSETFEEDHISYHVWVLKNSLYVMGFTQENIEAYIPDFDLDSGAFSWLS